MMRKASSNLESTHDERLLASDLAGSDRGRLATIKGLGRRLQGADTSIQHSLDELAVALTASLCDGCAIVLMPPSGVTTAVTRHTGDSSGEALAGIARVTDPVVRAFKSSDDARAELPAAYAAYVDRFGLRGLAIIPFPSRHRVRGVVTVTRDGGSESFDSDDLDTIMACVEYASLAVDRAECFETERVSRARVVQFQEQVIGIVGHDLRGPLGAIMIGTELLERKDPAVMSVVKRIGASAARMSRMVDQLLDMTSARLGQGIAVVRTKSHLSPIITGVIDELAVTYSTAKFQMVAGPDVSGVWDRDRLGQVMVNLLSNAVHYGLDGAPIIIEVGSVDGATTIAVHNSVRNEAITPAALETLFEPYRRGARDARHNASGLGVGLYIVYEIVHAHGGSITVASDESRTSFRIVLPAA